MTPIIVRLLAVISVFLFPCALLAKNAIISGRVTTPDGKPLAEVAVSDGVSIVRTDADGKYELISDKRQGTVFVITPSGYMAPSTDGFQPSFWALLDKDSYDSERHDFILKPENQENFAVMFMPDLHLILDSIKNDGYYFDNETLPLINRIKQTYGKEDPVYGMNLGDFSQDLYWYSHSMPVDKVRDYVASKGLPIPFYSVSGNHDNDAAIIGDSVDIRSEWLYHRTLGPGTYSVNIGNTHWIMLDNIIYKNRPGRGKKNVGVKGDRSYDVGFTRDQMKWLKKDIASVPDSMRVFICCHAPLVFTRDILKNPKQLARLDDMLSRFDNVTIFSGHLHRNVYFRGEQYPRFEQNVIVATSGDMWQSSRHYRTLGSDGSDAGILVCRFSPDSVEYDYLTYLPGDNLFRAYDLNSVGKYYRTNSGMQLQDSIYPTRTDYSDPIYTGKVLINFWGEREGRRLEVLENGHPVKIKKHKKYQDPLYNVVHYIPKVQQSPVFNRKDLRLNNAHMYLASPKSSTSTLEIRVVDNEGNVIKRDTMERPREFNPVLREQ